MLRHASKVMERGGYVGGEVIGEVDVTLVDQGGSDSPSILHDVDLCVAGPEVTHAEKLKRDVPGVEPSESVTGLAFDLDERAASRVKRGD